jgi:hypothetical protein
MDVAGEDDDFADADGDNAYRRPTPPTIDVVREGLARFAVSFYGEEMANALAKAGILRDRGEMGCKQLKRITKRIHMMIGQLNEGFVHVLPPGAMGACFAKLVDMLTVDIAGIIAAYHIRVQVPSLCCRPVSSAQAICGHFT